ncbi:MAG: SDR family oxidoreductase [Alphaproteobacteria bacterium]|nr:SDR family oxidoreductase [Alphaproteobacteria bacterium]
MASLDQKLVLITGGAGLLGLEHGVAVATAGGIPILVDIDVEALAAARSKFAERMPNSQLETRVADICSRAALEELADEISTSLGDVDCLINNAAVNPTMDDGYSMISGALETYPIENWSREFEVGVTGALLMIQVFGAKMAGRGRGSIVNIASDLGVIAPDHRIYTPTRNMEDVTSFKPVSYSVGKHALIGLTKYVATYWGHVNVRCNALAPGGVFNGQNESLVDGLEDRIPLRRMAYHDEYHDAVIFLCSDASSYMTGQVLVMDGGRSVW